MPSTALKINMLILFTMLIAAIAASPYAPAALLRSIVEMLARPCLARLGRPVVTMSARIGSLNFAYLGLSEVCVFLRMNIVSSKAHEMYCDIAVARPAPNIPMPIFCMKSMSKKMLRIPPEVRPIMAKNARPSYLRILFITQLDTSAGAAASMQIAYVLA